MSSLVLRVSKKFNLHYLYDSKEVPESKALRKIYDSCLQENTSVNRAFSDAEKSLSLCITSQHEHTSRDLDYDEALRHFQQSIDLFGKTLPELSLMASDIVNSYGKYPESSEPYELLLVERIQGEKIYRGIYVSLEVFSRRRFLFLSKKKARVKLRFIYKMSA